MFHKPKKLLTIALLVLITLMLCSAIVVFSSNAYVVYEGEAVTTFSSKEDITLNALTANGFVISEDKYVEMPENASFGITKVYIYNKNKVTLKDGIETRTLYSYNNQTVEDFLTENEITLGEFDSVSIPLTDEITGDLEFSITRVSHTTREETVSIPFQTEQRPSDALYKNTTKVIQKLPIIRGQQNLNMIFISRYQNIIPCGQRTRQKQDLLRKILGNMCGMIALCLRKSRHRLR